MCGIIGYVGKKNNTVDVMLDGLKSLEYRGYDSAGIAFVLNNKLKIVKAKGKVKNLEESLIDIKCESLIGIGHTRWATHGIPNDVNSHPHKVGNVTIVHNGIIENYEELRKELVTKGYKFKSETDTEVAAALIDYISKGESDKIKVLIALSKKLVGAYALGIIFDNDLNSLYAIRKDSPLLIGIGDKEHFIASDVPAFLKYTNKYVLLEKNQYAKIEEDKITIYDNKYNELEYKIEESTCKFEDSLKNGYNHFMLKEIYEQPKTIKNIVNMYLNNINDIVDISKYENIHIVGCGSAMHAGMIGKYLIEKNTKSNISVEIASEYRYRSIYYNEKTLVIIISQSGETADSLAALKKAKENNVDTLAIVNVVGSSIARESKYVMYMYVGPEIAVATTKALTGQVAILAMMALKLQYKDKIDMFINKDLKNVSNNIDIILNYDYKSIAKNLYKKNHIFFIGRGIDYPVCMEGSLKLKEISYIHSEAYPAGELKHGTLSLVEEGTPVIAVATDKELLEKTISNIKESKSRGAYVIYITTKELDVESDFYDKKIVLPDTNSYINPILSLVALQLLAYETAKMKELDIDKPRNLAKSVTVE